MKFADKYEILEMVTSGRVSTFLARERTTQEAVVVYTFECAGTGTGDLSTAAIIARFCALAPNPPGMIVKAGFDEPSSAAFLTTKMPDPVALKAWVSAYHSYGKTPAAVSASTRPASGPAGDETAELSASEVRAVLARTGRPQKQPPVENLSEEMGSGTAAFSLSTPEPAKPQSAGDFTRLFQEVNAFQPVPSSKSPAPPPPPKPSNATDAVFGELLGGSPLGERKFSPPPTSPRTTPVPAEPSPGSFTREFMGIPGDQAVSTPAAQNSAAPSQNEPGAFTREFMGISQKDIQGGDSVNRGAPATPKSPSSPATSFESIFGSPSPSSSPSSAGPAENQKGGTGEFTSFFRDPFESPGTPPKSIETPDFDRVAPSKPAAGDFTKMFGPDDIGRAGQSPVPRLDSEAPPAAGSFTEMFRQPSSVPPQKPSQSSQLGGATLGTSPNLRPSFLDPSPDSRREPSTLNPSHTPVPPQGSVTAPPPLADPFFSNTPVFPSTPAPPASPSFVNSSGMNSPGMNRPASTTDFFGTPTADAPPMEQAPSGPSEFTVFLSRSQLNASLASAPGAGSGNPAGSGQRPVFAPPPVPEPAFHFAPPPPPAVKLPAAPAPPLPASAPKPAGFWPLIVVLTVLLAIAGLLVMYFALKH
jgi:hypothetical protein